MPMTSTIDTLRHLLARTLRGGLAFAVAASASACYFDFTDDGWDTRDPSPPLGGGAACWPAADVELDAYLTSLCLPELPRERSTALTPIVEARTDADGCNSTCTTARARVERAVATRAGFADTQDTFPGNIVDTKAWATDGALVGTRQRLAPQRVRLERASGAPLAEVEVAAPGADATRRALIELTDAFGLDDGAPARVSVTRATTLEASALALGFSARWLEEADVAASRTLGLPATGGRFLVSVELPALVARVDAPWRAGAAFCDTLDFGALAAEVNDVDALGRVARVEYGRRLVLTVEASGEPSTFQAAVAELVAAARRGVLGAGGGLAAARTRGLVLDAGVGAVDGRLADVLRAALSPRSLRFSDLRPIAVEVTSLSGDAAVPTTAVGEVLGASSCAVTSCPVETEALTFRATLGPRFAHVSGTRTWRKDRCDALAPTTIEVVNEGAPWCAIAVVDDASRATIRTARLELGARQTLRLDAAVGRTLRFDLEHAAGPTEEQAELDVPCGTLTVVARCR
jgi:hypothetical protein